MGLQYMEYELEQKVKDSEDFKKRETRRKELERKMEELEKDELWKEKHLRLCPKCKRGIEKLSGCDSMVRAKKYFRF
tara:strand:- start:88 stop:318 length:231 start_codon:yes stop_codon:yes gene_type:complete